MYARWGTIGNIHALRIWGALTYLVGGSAFIFAFPATPDEVLRIEVVRAVLNGATYVFFWPVGNMVMIALNPLFHLNILEDLHAVRVFNFLVSAAPLVALILRCERPVLLLSLPLLFPYTWLITATASQQGLVLALLICVVWGLVARRWVPVFFACAGLYFVNPAMLVVVPTTMCCLTVLGRASVGLTATTAAAYIPMAIIVCFVWATTGDLLPTLTGNGGLNLWLGNNPHPLSHRGLSDADATVRSIEGVIAYWNTDPAGFAMNLLRKAALYWAPWDYLRSGLGGSLQPIVFSYIAVSQIVILATLWRCRRDIDPRALAFGIIIALIAWLLYTAFFVKVRFRVPFDMLLFAICMFPTSRANKTTQSGASR